MYNRFKAQCIVIALIFCVLTFFTQGTLAYYSTVGKATNVVTSGNIQFIIHEKTDAGTDFPAEGVYIVPGDIVSKQVSFESDCEHPFYLRTKILYGIDSQELAAEECFKLNINEEYWEYLDGWYYYTKAIEPGEMTPILFSHVEIVGAKVDNRYIGKALTLTVDAQAVQSENNPISNNDVSTALGWPTQ